MAANTPQAVKKWNSIATEENRIIGRIGKAGVSMKDLNALQKLLSEQHTLTTKLFSNWMNSAEDKAEYISKTFDKDYEKTLNEIIRSELGKTVANVNQLVHDQTTVINMLDGFSSRMTAGFSNLHNLFVEGNNELLKQLFQDASNDRNYAKVKKVQEEKKAEIAEKKEKEKEKKEDKEDLNEVIYDAIDKAILRHNRKKFKNANKSYPDNDDQIYLTQTKKEYYLRKKLEKQKKEHAKQLEEAKAKVQKEQEEAILKRGTFNKSVFSNIDALKEARKHDLLWSEKFKNTIKHRFSLRSILLNALAGEPVNNKDRVDRKVVNELAKYGISKAYSNSSLGQRFVFGARGEKGEYLAPAYGEDYSKIASILNLLQYGKYKHQKKNITSTTKRWGDRYLDKKRRMRENWEKRLGILSKGYGKLRNSISRLGDLLRNPASFIIDMLPKLAAGVFMVGALKLAWKYAEDFLAGKVNSVLDDINSFLPKKWQFSWRMGKGNTKVGDLGKWNHDQDANVKYKTVENRTHHFNSSELMTEPKPYSIQKVYESGKKIMPDANGNIYIGKINGQDTWVDKNGMRFQEDKVDGSNYTSKRYLDSYKNNPSKDSIKIETFDKYGKIIPKLEEKISKSRSLGKTDTENKLKEEVNQTKVSSDNEIPKGWYRMNPNEAGYVPPKLTYHDDDTDEDYTVNNPDYKPGVNLRKKGDPNARIKTMDGRSYRKVNPTSAQHAKTSRVSQVDPSKAITINPVEKVNSSPKVNKAPMGTAGAMITPSNSRPQPPISVQPLNDF